MDQLVKRVLSVRSRLTPVDRSGVMGDPFSIERYMFSVAFHRQLLQVRRKALQILLIRQHGYRLRTEKVVVPKRQQAHEHREVGLEGGGAEMLIHLVKAMEHDAEILGT